MDFLLFHSFIRSIIPSCPIPIFPFNVTMTNSNPSRRKSNNPCNRMMSFEMTGGNSSHRERLLQQQDMFRRNKSQLDNARKVLEETEQVALEIGTKLGNNRDQIRSALKNTRFSSVGSWYTST
jgi:hypothetical protein